MAGSKQGKIKTQSEPCRHSFVTHGSSCALMLMMPQGTCKFKRKQVCWSPPRRQAMHAMCQVSEVPRLRTASFLCWLPF